MYLLCCFLFSFLLCNFPYSVSVRSKVALVNVVRCSLWIASASIFVRVYNRLLFTLLCRSKWDCLQNKADLDFFFFFNVFCLNWTTLYQQFLTVNKFWMVFCTFIITQIYKVLIVIIFCLLESMLFCKRFLNKRGWFSLFVFKGTRTSQLIYW